MSASSNPDIRCKRAGALDEYRAGAALGVEGDRAAAEVHLAGAEIIGVPDPLGMLRGEEALVKK